MLVYYIVYILRFIYLYKYKILNNVLALTICFLANAVSAARQNIAIIGIGVDNQHIRDTFDPVLFCDVSFLVMHELDLEVAKRTHRSAKPSPWLLQINGYHLNSFGAAAFLNRIQYWEFFHAWSTPGRPKRDNRDTSKTIRNTDVCPAGGLAEIIRRGATDVHRRGRVCE